MIVTLGAAGLMLQTAGEEAVRIPVRKVEVASTHGAGDVFVGSLAAELSTGTGLLQAAKVAQAAAALWVSTAPELRDRMTAAAVRDFLRDSPQAVELRGGAAENPGLLVG